MNVNSFSCSSPTLLKGGPARQVDFLSPAPVGHTGRPRGATGRGRVDLYPLLVGGGLSGLDEAVNDGMRGGETWVVGER